MFFSSSMEASHVNERDFLYRILRMAIKFPNLFSVDQSEMILKVAIEDEKDNLYGEPRSAALDGYNYMLNNVGDLSYVYPDNIYQYSIKNQGRLEVFLADWIDNNFPVTNDVLFTINTQLHQLRLALLNNNVELLISSSRSTPF